MLSFCIFKEFKRDTIAVMSKGNKQPSDDLSASERYKQLGTKQVMAYLSISTTRTVWDYVKTGKLPKPRYLSAHKPIWQLGEVIDHTQKLMTHYDDAPRTYRGDPALKKQAQKVKSNAGLASSIRERLFGK